MEEIIKQFLSITLGSGSGNGDSSGSGNGDSSGSGSGYGYGDGDGYGYGYGYGYGDGDGDGDGDGYGYGDGDGYGYGDGDGDDLSAFNEDKVYLIDSIPTIIKNIRGNVAKGFILHNDLTLEETFVVKDYNRFAHGRTLHEAFQSLQEKLYDSSTEEERIQAFKEHFKDFNKRYPAKELFTWHHVLTGSCKQGRESFCKSNGIDIEKDQFSIHEFINLTKFAYGGETIRKLV